MKKLYVIASTWKGSALTIDHYFTPEKAVKALSELLSDEYGKKTNPDDDPKKYIQDYYEWVQVENDNVCEIDVALEVIDL